MIPRIFLMLLLGSCLAFPARAISTSGTVVTTTPTVTDWTTGWTTSGDTGSNYVGYIGTPGSGSGIYLGNDWVLTAGHVGAGTFTLGGIPYSAVAGSAVSITSGSDTADLTLFKITGTGTLALNPLVLSADSPVEFASSNSPSQVVMLGYGGSGTSLSWGYDTVDLINQPVSVLSYNSNDFFSILGTASNGSTMTTNNSILVAGDSGGGDFLWDSTRNAWILAGVNEVTGIYGTGTTNNLSGFVQLDTYAYQIGSITGVMVVPEPSVWLLLGAGGVFLYLCRDFTPRALISHRAAENGRDSGRCSP